MKKRILSMLGIFLVLALIQSCGSSPEKDLLSRYFHALSMNDVSTLSTMAINPVTIDVKNWEITEVTEEEVIPAKLPELDKKEKELKKKVEDSVSKTLDSRDKLDEAKFELDNARTRAAKREAQKKVDELQKKYDKIYENHKELQKKYNEAKAKASREEEISSFSIGAGEIPTIRDLTGDIHKKQVTIQVTNKEGEVQNYKFFLRRYILQNEATNKDYRGRWIIVKIKKVE